jgi:hypothetical protein
MLSEADNAAYVAAMMLAARLGHEDIIASAGEHVSFPLTKLMSSMLPHSYDDTNDGDDDTAKTLFNSAVDVALEQTISSEITERINQVNFSLKRKLVILAYEIYSASLLVDGDRISLNTKARRYVELVCLFLDKMMLIELYQLRTTCKSNDEQRTFPVFHSPNQELEANLIEIFVAYDASRFVPSETIKLTINYYYY